jgi:hypothetical protein
MRRYFYSLISAILLSGCSTLVPITQQFPEAPPALIDQSCPSLELAPMNTREITELLKVVIRNYQLYYMCSNRVSGWQDWYREQRRIYDGVYQSPWSEFFEGSQK